MKAEVKYSDISKLRETAASAASILGYISGYIWNLLFYNFI